MPDVLPDGTPDSELLDATGEKTYTAYAKGTRSVELLADDETASPIIEVTPYDNGGPRSGFTPIMTLSKKVPYTTPEDFGEVILEALTNATS